MVAKRRTEKWGGGRVEKSGMKKKREEMGRLKRGEHTN